jgi:serine/threonine-protein kinase
MVMVYVPAGEFQMGTADEEADDALKHCDMPNYAECQPAWFEREQPAHTVALDAFWIDSTEVTNAQFATFLNEQGNQEEAGVTWLWLEHDYSLIELADDSFQPKDGYADHPVTMVSFPGAVAYCEWAGGRLPTEAEWEYVARGPEGRIFPWGDTFDGMLLNYCDASCDMIWADGSTDDGHARTAPVGSYPEGASWCGAMDLAGNVAEWVADWYGPYAAEAQENPTGPEFGEFQLGRGGGWELRWNFARGTARSEFTTEARGSSLGFRCTVPAGE